MGQKKSGSDTHLSQLTGVSQDEFSTPSHVPLMGRDPDLAAVDAEVSDEIQNLIDTRVEESDQEKHAFVIMPYGIKNTPNGDTINFDQIYDTFLKPALEAEGFEPFRADEETVSGDIHTDMFQELLLADIVVADLSIHNANVFYELGVRHAFRKRGIVHVRASKQGESIKLPFDVFNIRTIKYDISAEGVTEEKPNKRNIHNFRRVVKNTWDSTVETIHSPIYNLLTGLKEPEKKTLTTPLATGFWRDYTDWQERVEIAQRRKLIGDILLLTDEISNPFLKEEAIGEVGRALQELGRHELALTEYRKGLLVNPKNRDFRRQEARLLNALGRVDAAIVKFERLIAEQPDDTVSARFLGEIYTALWKDCWTDLQDTNIRRRAAFETFPWLIKALDTYLDCFRSNLNVHETGIKAVTLASVLIDLANEYDDAVYPSKDIARIRKMLPNLKDTLGFSLHPSELKYTGNYWEYASLAEWHLVNDSPKLIIERAYQKALSYSRRNLNYLRSTIQRLQFLHDIGFNQTKAEAAIQVVQQSIKRIESRISKDSIAVYPEPQSQVQAFLFTGHMIDAPETKAARFPESVVENARKVISQELEKHKADSNDHCFMCGASSGGDIIFIEECIKREMTVNIHMPYDEPHYIAHFVKKNDWVERYYKIRSSDKVFFHYQKDRVGIPRKDTDPYHRNIRWTLYCSLQMGIDKLHLIALWDGKSDSAQDADGERVSCMIDNMRSRGGRVIHLDTKKLIPGKTTNTKQKGGAVPA